MARFAALIAALLVMAAAGCGGGSSSSSSSSASVGGTVSSTTSTPSVSAAEQVAKHYYAAMANGDYAGACQDLAVPVQQGIGAQIAPDARGLVDPDVKANLDRATISAATAMMGVTPPPADCVKVLKGVMKDVPKNLVRAATVSVALNQNTGVGQVTGLPDTSPLLAQVLPQTFTLNQSNGTWKITQLTQVTKSTEKPRVPLK